MKEMKFNLKGKRTRLTVFFPHGVKKVYTTWTGKVGGIINSGKGEFTIAFKMSGSITISGLPYTVEYGV